MKRSLFNLVVALSLLLSLAAAAAWAMSYARPLDWHLLGIAHSPDLRREPLNQPGVVSMKPVPGPNVAGYGFWDALWLRSRSGRATLVGQTIDYEGNLRQVYASPPSLIVDLPGGTRAVAFGRMPDSRGWTRRLGFAWDHHAQQTVDERSGTAAPVTVHVRMLTLPHWLVVALGLPLPLLRLRVRRRPRA